jgi:hypothetical protein
MMRAAPEESLIPQVEVKTADAPLKLKPDEIEDGRREPSERDETEGGGPEPSKDGDELRKYFTDLTRNG